MKILNDKPFDIPLDSLPERKLAVITVWPQRVYVGTFVIRHRSLLIGVNDNNEHRWWSDDSNILFGNSECRVRVLEPGTQIEI